MNGDDEFRRLLEAESEHAEAVKDEPIPAEALVPATRPGRARSAMFSVRLNPDELAAVQSLAESPGRSGLDAGAGLDRAAARRPEHRPRHRGHAGPAGDRRARCTQTRRIAEDQRHCATRNGRRSRPRRGRVRPCPTRDQPPAGWPGQHWPVRHVRPRWPRGEEPNLHPPPPLPRLASRAPRKEAVLRSDTTPDPRLERRLKPKLAFVSNDQQLAGAFRVAGVSRGAVVPSSVQAAPGGQPVDVPILRTSTGIGVFAIHYEDGSYLQLLVFGPGGTLMCECGDKARGR